MEDQYAETPIMDIKSHTNNRVKIYLDEYDENLQLFITLSVDRIIEIVQKSGIEIATTNLSKKTTNDTE